MSEFDKAKELLGHLKAHTGSSSKMMSTKLLVTVGAAVGMIWLAKANFALILWQLTILLGTWLACRTIHDVILEMEKGKTKRLILENTMKDGTITDSEKAIIDEISK